MRNAQLLPFTAYKSAWFIVGECARKITRLFIRFFIFNYLNNKRKWIHSILFLRSTERNAHFSISISFVPIVGIWNISAVHLNNLVARTNTHPYTYAHSTGIHTHNHEFCFTFFMKCNSCDCFVFRISWFWLLWSTHAPSQCSPVPIV